MAVCPNCGTESPDTFKFCPGCGAPLDQAPQPEAEERKVVSVLFVDLVGFTARSHDADPEDVRAALAPYHRLLKSEIEAFGGTVEKFIGDAVMAVFGAPMAHEDDAERAVRAALRIAEAIEELNEATPNLDLSIRAAVNTGEGLVTLGARPQAGEGMVTGDVVNTASRLQGIAPVGGVAVGEITYRSTKDLIVYEELEAVAVKGKPEPIPVWSAVSARSRFGVDVDIAPKTPFIGRDFDLGALKNAYQRTLRESSVQLVTITGEPGVGKTRLLGEFSSFVDEQDEIVYWRQGRSLPYGEGITFWALGEIIKAQAGILESDSPEIASDKLQVAVEAVVEETDERAWFIARLSPLVGAQTQSGGGIEKEESFTAWRRFLEAIAYTRPLVLVFEDLHWADAAMLEFIDHLVEWSTGVPLLVVCTARPELYERHEGWGGGKRNSNTISLSALSDSETAQLISALLSQAVLPAEVHAALLERAGGNPLYAEEFIRMLSDRGILQRRGRVLSLDPDADITMPDNVQALIAARLDTLPAERKALLHDASVAGKVFWSGAVSALGERDDREVREGLHELARKELVRPARASSMEDQQEYSFWHALVRDVAYGQIPRALKATKHRAIAEWIEHIAGSRVRDHAEVLAHHYQEALRLARACGLAHEREELESPTIRFLILAGDRAMSLDVGKARRFYENALRYLSTDDPQRANVMLNLAKASHGAGELEAARELYEGAITQLLARGDAGRAGDAIMSLFELLWFMGDVSGTATLIHKAIEILEPHGPGVELALAYSLLSSVQSTKGLPQKGLQLAEKALAMAERIGSPEAVSGALANRGAARCSMGDPAGTDDLWESVRLSKELGLGIETSVRYANLAIHVELFAGPTAAVAICKESLDFARNRGLRAEEMWIEGVTAGTLYRLGEWDQALQKIEGVMKWSEENEALQLKVVVLLTKVRIVLSRGEAAVVATLSGSMLQHARSMGEPQVVLPALVAAAEAAEMLGDERAARQLMEEFEAALFAHPLLGSENLPDAVRLSVAQGATETAAAMIKTVEEAPYSTPFSKRCLHAAHAAVAEAQGRLEEGLSLHKESEQLWGELERPMERGHSLLGAGRCLIALGDRKGATAPLHKARAIFERLGAVPLINETDSYLQAEAAS